MLASGARITTRQNPFATFWGGTLARACLLRYGIHASELRIAHSTLSISKLLQKTVAGMYWVDMLHARQPRILLVVVHRTVMLLDVALLNSLLPVTTLRVLYETFYQL